MPAQASNRIEEGSSAFLEQLHECGDDRQGAVCLVAGR